MHRGKHDSNSQSRITSSFRHENVLGADLSRSLVPSYQQTKYDRRKKTKLIATRNLQDRLRSVSRNLHLSARYLQHVIHGVGGFSGRKSEEEQSARIRKRRPLGMHPDVLHCLFLWHGLCARVEECQEGVMHARKMVLT